MSPHQPLEWRLNNLVDDVNAGVRADAEEASRILYQARSPVGVALGVSRWGLHLLDVIFARTGHGRPNDNFNDCIARLAKGDPAAKVVGLGVLPGPIADLLHPPRKRSNDTKHAIEEVPVAPADAVVILESFLRVVEWFYCESPLGPRLSTLYRPAPAADPARPHPPADRDDAPVLTVQAMVTGGLLAELAQELGVGSDADMVLALFDFPRSQLPGTDNRQGFWLRVCRLVEGGVVRGDRRLERLLGAAAAVRPGHARFAPYQRYAPPSPSA